MPATALTTPVLARNALVEKWQFLPAHVVGCHARHPAVRRLGGFDDAVQVGMLGLIRAAELWDATRGGTSRRWSPERMAAHLHAALGCSSLPVDGARAPPRPR